MRWNSPYYSPLQTPRTGAAVGVGINLHVGVVSGGVRPAVHIKRFCVAEIRRNRGVNRVYIPPEPEPLVRVRINLHVPFICVLCTVHVKIIAPKKHLIHAHLPKHKNSTRSHPFLPIPRVSSTDLFRANTLLQ